MKKRISSVKRPYWIIPLMAAVAFWLFKPQGVECAVTVEPMDGGDGVEIYRQGDSVIIEDCFLPWEDSYTTVRAEAEVLKGRLDVTVRHDHAASETQMTGNHVRLTVELPEDQEVRNVKVTVVSQQRQKYVFEEPLAEKGQ